MNPTAGSKNKKILIVEDEAILAKTLEDTLTSMGYQVVGIADTGIKAIFQFASSSPDIVLMDIHLKGTMDGIETAQKIRSQLAIPIVFLTAHQDPIMFERAKIEGAYGYILKPFQERELELVIEIALNQVQSRKRNSDGMMALLHGEKIEAIRTMAGEIVHEMEVPLTKIRTEIENLDELITGIPELGSHPSLASAVRNLQMGAQSMKSTFKYYQSMMNAAPSETASPIRVQEACEEAIEICRYSAFGQKVKFKELQGSPNSTATFYRTALIQLLVNLIQNACDAVENTADAWVQISWSEVDGGSLILKVADSGHGIRKEVRERMFKPFFTTKSREKGTGLGLALCRRVVEKSGGSIHLDLESATTCFNVKLPI